MKEACTKTDRTPDDWRGSRFGGGQVEEAVEGMAGGLGQKAVANSVRLVDFLVARLVAELADRPIRREWRRGR